MAEVSEIDDAEDTVIFNTGETSLIPFSWTKSSSEHS